MEQGYRSTPFQRARRAVVDAGRLATRRHIVHGLLEIDVTRARRLIADHAARTRQRLSFTGFVVTCLAEAVQAHPMVHAYRSWRNQLVLFDDVDVVTLIETEVGGVAVPHIIRAANRKSLYDVHQEIRTVQTQPAESVQAGGLTTLGRYAPRFVRNLFYWGLRQNPHWMKRYAGTVVVTAVGMFGQGAGWGLGFLPMHTLGLTIGGIAERPGLIDGKLSPREHLCLTVSFDHDIVDGAPAARFAQALRGLVESAYGLPDERS